MSALVRWKRVGKGSGPGNVLNDRYEVVRGPSGKWLIRDRQTGQAALTAGGLPLDYPTMAIARRRAERLVAEDRVAER